jgi:hypothetical protein
MSLLSFGNKSTGTGHGLGIGSTPTVDWSLLVFTGVIGLIFGVVFFGQKFLIVDSVGVVDDQVDTSATRGIDLKKLDQALKVLSTLKQEKQNVQ